MHKKNNQMVYSPSDLTVYMDSPFDSWMDRHDKEFPGEYIADETDAGTKILQTHGDRHEKAFLQQLKDRGLDVLRITEYGDQAKEATVAAMRRGHQVIFQAVLSKEEFAGKSDFLFKVNGASKLGDYHYEAWDTKLAKKAKPYFAMQLCCYSDMLEHIQGRLPEFFRVVLGDLTEKEFRTEDFINYYRHLKQSFLTFQTDFSKDNQPEDCTAGAFSPWKTISEQILEDRDDLSRVAGMRKLQIVKLKSAGIDTLTALAQTSETNIAKIKPEMLERLKKQAQLQIKTVASGKTAYEPLQHIKGKGFALLPPPSPADVFFDMEGYPHADEGLEYLFGAILRCKPEPEFKDWWAHDRKEEQIAFEAFIDWVYARWLATPSMHIYHYAAYEVTAMRRLACRFNSRVEKVDELLRNEVFVDLYTVVKQSLCVGEPSYSIKKVEHLYRGQRDGTVSNAGDSIVFYENWLEDKDGDTWRDSKYLKDIRDYNEIDCISTLELCDWLDARQKEYGFSYTGKIAVPPDASKPLSDAASLAEKLIAEADQIEDAEKQRVQRLLAYFLEFHKREDKPSYWRMFDRQKATEEELFDDLDCLSGLRRTKTLVYLDKSLSVYEYSFDPNQDTKLDAGRSCKMVHDLSGITIKSMDRKTGIVCLSQGSKKPAPHDSLSLMVYDIVTTDGIADSIYRSVLKYSKTGYIRPALAALLFRQAQNIKGVAAGETVSKSSNVDDVNDAVSAMNETVMCIQGPPGAGKTYTASHTIVALLKQNKRVGITSNSHKAIENLLDAVVRECRNQNVRLNAAKIGGTELMSTSVEYFGEKKAFFEDNPRAYNLIAGTAWLFSAPEAENLLDYLFIDEAGQVCLANVVAMSQATKNLVMLGDQMQLEQPCQGTHPEDCDNSCLEYYLQGHATIPPELGIFLGTTWRMHPDLCALISSAVYENRLLAEPANVHQQLVPPAELEERFRKRAGISWLPVMHDGNTQASEEEADEIQRLVADLLKCKFVDKHKVERPMKIDDILIVAPYNMQVRMIQDRIPNALVASVDKFQGREAPVVILSMCASDGNASPRGISFLFNKNRLNVALSRAMALAIVVGHPRLADTACSSLEQIRMLNFFNKIVEEGPKAGLAISRR